MDSFSKGTLSTLILDVRCPAAKAHIVNGTFRSSRIPRLACNGTFAITTSSSTNALAYLKLYTFDI